MKVQIGDKIKIIDMNGEPQYAGKEGIVERIDDVRQIHTTAGGCALIPEYDIFKIIRDGKETMNEI